MMSGHLVLRPAARIWVGRPFMAATNASPLSGLPTSCTAFRKCSVAA